MEVTDLLEVYPDPDDPEFNRKITRKKEFADLSMQEPVKLGNIFPHQQLLMRLMSTKTPLKEMLVLWPTGRGKTRVALEMVRTVMHYPRMYGNDVNNQKIIIISPRSVTEVWKREIKKMAEFIATDKVNKRALTIAISKYIELQSQDYFWKVLASLSNEDIRKIYSRALIIIDEVHTLRNTKKVTELFRDAEGVVSDVNINGLLQGVWFAGSNQPELQQNVGNQGDYYTIKLPENTKSFDRFGITWKSTDIIIFDNGSWRKANYIRDTDSKTSFLQIRRLMQLTKGMKMIMTATPIPDKISDLPSIVSLILPEDRQLNINSLQEANAAGEKALYQYLEPRLRGRLSYVPMEVDKTIWIEEGEPFSRYDATLNAAVTTTIKVWPCQMLDEQYAVYNTYVDVEDEGDIEDIGYDETAVSNDKFTVGTRKALNFIYIDPTNPAKNSSEGFEYIDDANDGKVKKRIDKGIKDGTPDGFVIVDPPLLITAAEQDKRDTIKKELKQRRAEGEQVQERKIANWTFAFKFENELFAGLSPRPANLKHGDPLPQDRMELIRRMSCKAYEIINMVHYNHRFPGEPEFTFYYHPWIRDGGGILLGMCFDLVGYDRFIGDHNDINLFGDEKPRYSYMMGEPGSTKLQVENIQNIVNHPKNRFGGYVMIVIASNITATGWSFLNARKFIHGGPDYTLFDQPKGRVKRLDSHQFFDREDQRYVRMFLLAATTPEGTQTTDHRIWYLIQKKMNIIARPMRILERIAIDCALNTRTNAPQVCYGTQVDADGLLLKVPVTADPIDVTTYNTHWAADEIEVIENEIRQVFRVISSITFKQLIDIISRKNHHPSTIVWALAQMLNREEIIEDRYGINKILREANGVYFLSDLEVKTITKGIKPALTLPQFDVTAARYCDTLHLNYPRNFDSMLKSYVTTAIDFDTLKNQWESNTMAPTQKLVMFENALLGKIADANIRNYILRDMQPCWFVLRRGNNVTIFHYFKEYMNSVNNAKDANKNVLLMGKNKKIKLRIKSGSEDTEFRDTDKSEDRALIPLINQRWLTEEQRIYRESGNSFVGIFNSCADRAFRIKVYKPGKEPDKIADYREIDGRGESGRKIDEKVIPEIMDIIWELQMRPPPRAEELDVPEPPKTDALLRNKILDLMEIRRKPSMMAKYGPLVQQWDRTRLEFYFNWLEDRGGRKEYLSENLFQYLDNRGWIWYK